MTSSLRLVKFCIMSPSIPPVPVKVPLAVVPVKDKPTSKLAPLAGARVSVPVVLILMSGVLSTKSL